MPRTTTKNQNSRLSQQKTPAWMNGVMPDLPTQPLLETSPAPAQLPSHVDGVPRLTSHAECAACHGSEGLVFDPALGNVAFCRECLERGHAPESQLDTGGSG